MLPPSLFSTKKFEHGSAWDVDDLTQAASWRGSLSKSGDELHSSNQLHAFFMTIATTRPLDRRDEWPSNIALSSVRKR